MSGPASATKVVRGAGPASQNPAGADQPVPDVAPALPDADDLATAGPEPEPAEGRASSRSEARLSRWLLCGAISAAAHIGAGLYLASITLPADPGVVEPISVEWVQAEASPAKPDSGQPAKAAERPAEPAPQPDPAPEKPAQEEAALPEPDKSPAAAPQPQEEAAAPEPETPRETPPPAEESAAAAKDLASAPKHEPTEPSQPAVAAESKPAPSVQKPTAQHPAVRQAERKKPSRKPADERPASRQAHKSTPKTAKAGASSPPERAQRPAAASPGRSAASGSPKASGRAGMSPAKWQAEVNAHIRRFKQYPPGAAGSASVRVQFRIDARGVVKSASAAGSSGNAALDRAAIETVKRASPVPAPPPEIARSSMTLVITINFKR